MTTKPIHVALFTDTYDEVNGVANTFRHLTEYCRKTNRHLDIYTHATDKDSVEESGSVCIHRYKPAAPVDIYFDMIFDLKLPRLRMFNEFRKRHYDLIHTATPGSMGLNALALARLDKIPLISSYHTSLPEYVRNRVEKIVQKFHLPTEHTGERSEDATWKYMQWYYNQTLLVLAPSEHTKALLEKKLKTKIGIFSRGIDTEKFHPRYREEHDGVVVIYVGRVSTEKNLDVLTEIFKGKEDAKLHIVGDGPYRQEMQEHCPTAIFPGFLNGAELSRAYASADIFIFPSTTDTFGNVVLEAMSSALPVIVTDKMGPKEIVRHGENGFITTGTKDMRNKLQMLIDDEPLRKKMGIQARDYTLTRNWDAVFEQLFEDYRQNILHQ
ncbi:MAG: glycosyltransferase family 1 protein [Sedimentisphaerales bacterium]|nr:glycosyltransferase family 1 protein [Sedimentisphaerales bacterium]